MAYKINNKIGGLFKEYRIVVIFGVLLTILWMLALYVNDQINDVVLFDNPEVIDWSTYLKILIFSFWALGFFMLVYITNLIGKKR